MGEAIRIDISISVDRMGVMTATAGSVRVSTQSTDPLLAGEPQGPCQADPQDDPRQPPPNHKACRACDATGWIPLITDWHCTSCGQVVPAQHAWARDGLHRVRHVEGSPRCR